MISITCTHCQTVLNIDDAFAGGVCRCQHCGTIQTVPAHLKNGAPPAPAASKALYQNKARASAGAAPQGARRELDDLAQAVASSGLSNSGLSGSGSGLSNRSGSFPASTGRTSPRPAGPVKAASPAPATEQEQRRERKSVPLVPVLVIGGVLLVGLIGLGIFLALHGGDSSGTTTTTNTGGTGGTAVSGPGLCGVSIAAPSIVYVLDRGNAIANVFDPLKAATYHSLESLGPDRKFEVILWNNGGDDIAYPADSLANATPEEIEKCKRTLEDIVGTGNSHLRSALDKAMARQPSAIVIATGKDRLDDDDELALASAQEVAKGKVKFYTFAVGKQIENPVLKMAASATGGQYRQVSETELRNAP
ncbi:MAG: hypothetical protein JWL69_1529 [Phycisphaerales bacterium]|nr:hypothetical protein [Phycisphaerales bacterium]